LVLTEIRHVLDEVGNSTGSDGSEAVPAGLGGIAHVYHYIINGRAIPLFEARWEINGPFSDRTRAFE
jgi:hypothetical protein